MFNQFYNLSQNPFSESPDSSFFYETEHQCDVLLQFSRCVDQGQCFAMITGEVGTGKTLLCRTLLSLVEEEVESALVLFPDLEPVELLASICDEFAVEVPISADMAEIIRLLTDHLLQRAEAGKVSVLLIDEAQHLSLKVLDVFRAISEIKCGARSILQVGLFGQPELEALLQSHGAQITAARINCRLLLVPFSQSEVESYIKHRIAIAGGENYVQFSQEAAALIYQLSKGIPRLVHFQCQAALDHCAGKGVRTIGAGDVRASLRVGNSLLQTNRLLWGSEQKLVQL